MIRLAAVGLALLTLGAHDPEPAAPADPRDMTKANAAAVAVAQLTMRQQIIIRVPRHDVRVPAAASAPVRWRESGGPRCLPARLIAGALPSANSVDLLLHDNRRVRARLGQRCGGLDYYRGLYVNANPDGRICAGRDEVRSRMGGQCEIVEFRLLQPSRR